MVLEFQPREQREVTAELRNKFEHFSGFRSDYEQISIDDYMLYIGFKKELTEEQKKQGKRSNLHIPHTYEVIDTIRARIVSSFFGTRPYTEFAPQPEGGEAHQLYTSEQKSEVASALVDMQLEKNKIFKLFYDYMTSLLIFPAGIMSVGWRYEEKPVKRRIKVPNIVGSMYGPQFAGWGERVVESIEAIWDDNELSLVDFFDFWPDPRGKCIDSCRGVFQRETMTEEGLVEMLNFLYQLNEGVIYPVDLDALREQGGQVKDGVAERLAATNINISTIDGFLTEGPDRLKNQFNVLHYWEDNRHSILLNETECVYDGPSPYWRHRMKPFVVESFEPLPNQFYGLSGVRVINNLQHELNTQRNQRIDNVSLVLNRMWKVRRNSVLNKSQLVSRPGGVIEVDDPGDLQDITTQDVTGSSYKEEMITKQDMENALGAPPVVRGAEGTRAETATGQSLKATGAGIRFEVKIRLFECLGIARMIELMDLNNQQFISERRLVKLGPEESIQWREIGPGELIGEFDYRPAGTTLDPAANRELRRAQLSEMMQFLLMTQNPYIDFFEVTKAYVESFDLRNPQKFLIPREMIQRQLMMEQAMMAQQAMAPPQMAGQPPPTPQGTGPPMMGVM